MNPLSLAPTTVPDAEPLVFIDAAIAAGCDSIGLRVHRSPGLPFHVVVGNAPLIREMQHRLSAANLPVLDLFTFYLQPECDFDGFTRALELGATFGARYALVQGDDPQWARLVDTFGRFCALAAPLGIAAIVEFNPARPLATLSQAQQLLAATPQRNTAICVDPLHLARSGSAPEAVRNVDPHHLPYAQFSDGSLAPYARLLPGEGTLPLKALLNVLPADITLSVEVPKPNDANRSNDFTPIDWCRHVMNVTRAYLANA